MRSVEQLERDRDHAEFVQNARNFADAVGALNERLRKQGMGFAMRALVVSEWVRGYWRLVSASDDGEE
jgi:pantoate kinase